MKYLKRIIFEVVIIASVFAAVNFSYSKSKDVVVLAYHDKSAIEMVWKGFPGVAKAVDFETAMNLMEAWKKAEPGVKGKIPTLGYNPNAMKLMSFYMPADKLRYKYDPKEISYVSQALFRDSLISYTDDLEKRVRKLENTVNRIMAKCCPEAK